MEEFWAQTINIQIPLIYSVIVEFIPDFIHVCLEKFNHIL